MAVIVTEVLERIWCDRARQDAELLEERVYPDDRMPDVALSYQVRARVCSLGMECNLAGYPCKWAGTNPDHNPFGRSLR